MDINALKRDSRSLENGMWIGDIPGPDGKAIPGVRLKVRGTDSDAYVFAMSRAQIAADDGDLEQDGRIKPEALLRIRQRLLHEVVLVEWEGLTDAGEPVPYDADLAKAWLTEPDYRPFQDLVQRASGIVNAKVRERTEAAAKN